MSNQPPETRPSSGQETQDALRAVLEEQAERGQRQDDADPKPQGPSQAPAVIAVLLALVSVWLWFAPPRGLPPRPIPALSPSVQQSGLRMDVYMVAVQILRFQSRTGTLPATAEEAVFDPIQADAFEYAVTREGIFRLTAAQGDHVVNYMSDQPLEEFVGNAQIFLEGAGP